MPPSESSTNAQQPENRYPRKYSDAELLGALRQLLKERGDLSRRIIADSTNMRSAGTCDARFGCLTAAYRMIGFTPNQNDYGPVLKDRASRRPRPGGLVPEQMLEALRRLLKKHGYLTDKLIEKSEAVPAPTSYCRHFGGLLAAYRLIGYTPDPRRLRALRRPEGRSVPDQALLVSLREVLQRRGRLSNTIIDQERSLACSMTYINRFGSLRNAYGLIGYTPDRYQTRYNRPRGLSNREILDALRRLWQKKGRLWIEIIDRSPEVPSYKVFVSRFGCLSRAYALIGYPSQWRLRMRSLHLSNEAMLKKLRGLLKANGYLSGLLIERSVSLPTGSACVARFGGLKRAFG